MLTKTEIQKRLMRAKSFELPPESPYPNNLIGSQPNRAAVLIPFFKKNDDWHLLYIRRTEVFNDSHSGQVAFPGGRCDPSDITAENAALREAQEEVGIKPKDVQVLGHLRDLLTVTNYRVTPIVGVFPWPYKLVPQENEVARIFSIPLNWLLDSKNHQTEFRMLQNTGRKIPVIFFKEYDGELLWGASARITLLLLEALNLSSPGERYL